MLGSSEPLNVWLYSRDLGAAKGFYQGKLGLPLWREEPKEALHFGVGGALLSIHFVIDSELPPRGASLVFTVPEDVDRVYDELREHGVDFEKPLVDRPFGRSAMFRDPDGHELWLVQPGEAETQFQHWRTSHRLRARKIPVQRRPMVRRHERKAVSRRGPHPAEDLDRIP